MNKKNGIAIMLLGIPQSLYCTQHNTTPVKQNLPAHNIRSTSNGAKKQKEEQSSEVCTTRWRRTLGFIGGATAGVFLIKHFQLHNWAKHLFSPHTILPQNQENLDPRRNDSPGFPNSPGGYGSGRKSNNFGISLMTAPIAPEISSPTVTQNIMSSSSSSSSQSHPATTTLGVQQSSSNTERHYGLNYTDEIMGTAGMLQTVFCERRGLYGLANLSSQTDDVNVYCYGNGVSSRTFVTSRENIIRIRKDDIPEDPKRWKEGQKVSWTGAFNTVHHGTIVGVVDGRASTDCIVHREHLGITQRIPFSLLIDLTDSHESNS